MLLYTTDTMKTAVVVLLVLSVGAAIGFEHAEEWEVWKQKHSKAYKDDNEELYRRTIWTKNKAYVEEHNKHADKFGFTVAMNKFADLVSGLKPACQVSSPCSQYFIAIPFLLFFLFSPKDGVEFARVFNGYRQDLLGKSRNTTRVHKLSGLQQPDSVDWRDKNVVTDVKNQASDSIIRYINN